MAIEDGTYIIMMRPGGRVDLALDVPAGDPNDSIPVQLYELHFGPVQRWQITKVDEDKDGQYHTIVNEHTNKALDVPGGYPINSLVIQQYSLHGGPNQQWKIVLNPVVNYPNYHIPDFYNIYNRHTGFTLDNAGAYDRWGRTNDLLPLVQFPFHGGSRQRWHLIHLD